MYGSAFNNIIIIVIIAITYPIAAVHTGLLLNKYVDILYCVDSKQAFAWAKLHNIPTTAFSPVISFYYKIAAFKKMPANIVAPLFKVRDMAACKVRLFLELKSSYGQAPFPTLTMHGFKSISTMKFPYIHLPCQKISTTVSDVATTSFR